MKPSKVVGRKGTTGLMELSKVVAHRVLPSSQLPKGGWRKSCRIFSVVPLELVKKDKQFRRVRRMKKDDLFRCALRMKWDDLRLV